jgi:hypothetical protein
MAQRVRVQGGEPGRAVTHERSPSLNRQTRHLCVAIDAKGYSSLDAVAQEEAQAVLVRLLDGATAAAGLDRLSWLLQEQGDGELALVPPEQSEELVVDAFVRELDALLDRYNHGRLPEARLRLRMAVHFGVGYRAANGYAGPAPVIASRLLASDELHEALASAPGCDLAVALSDSLYSDVILNRFTSLRPEAFTPCLVKMKEFEGKAWIRLMHRAGATNGAAAPVSADAGDSVSDQTPPPASTGPGSGAGRTIRAENYVENVFQGDATMSVAGIQIGGRAHDRD